MNLRHLRCFIAVAEELHFGRAARRLHVEQSPLSRTIRQLEANLGVTLLERMPRGMRLTPAGQVFLEEARRVLREGHVVCIFAEGAISRVAQTLGIELDQVNVKAKTAEKMGPVGLGQAMEARAVVLLTC